MENHNQPEQEVQKDKQVDEDVLNENVPESFETISGSDESKAEGELKKLQDELSEAKDKYLRLYSEFDNFRRRTAKEKIELIQGASEQVVANLLPVLDDFERAEKAFQGSESKELEGFTLIYNKFKKIVEQAGVKPMELKAGDDFNPDVQEAITQMPVQDENMKGKVVDVVEKGYLLNEKVIRYAKVVVGN